MSGTPVPIIAIVGRPNVGKSTLFNRFAGRRRALVDDLPGITRDRIAEEVEVGVRRVLLVDTAGLDPEPESGIEAAIQSQLGSLMEGKTVIAIAHRLSTIAALDRLIVLDQGRIVEEGTHDDLLHQNGLYARLWARQSGGFLGVDQKLSA